MKKGLKITLITLAIIGALVIVFLVFVSFTAGPKLTEGVTIVKSLSSNIIDNVIKTQNYSDFSKYSSDALKAELAKEGVSKIYNIYDERLGKLVSYKEPQVQSINTMSGGAGNATVVTTAVFDKGGDATIEFIFTRNSNTDQWELVSFNINSKSLL